MDIKDIQEAIADGTKTVKADFEKARAEQGQKFESKVEGILENLKTLSTKEEVDAAVKTASDLMQGQFDELATKHNKKGQETEKLSFKDALAKSISENYEKISSADKIKGNTTIEMKNVSLANFPGFEDQRTDFRTGIIEKDRDVFHLRDILPVGSTTKEYIDVPREGDKTGTGPDAWLRGASIATTAAKPSFEPNFTKYKANVEWIAGIMRLPVEMLMDMPWLTSYLQNFAMAELMEAEDNQILNGNGTSPQLDGLLPNATAYDGAKTLAIERLIDASYGQLAESYHAATNLLLHPRDVVDLVLNKASGSGEYDLPGGTVGFVNGQLQVAGLAVNKTTKIAKGQFLLGDFRKAQLVQRMAPQLRFFEQDQDNVIKNLVTVRIEERLALAIFKTNAFIKGSLTPPPAV